jgi:hypothetical protein
LLLFINKDGNLVNLIIGSNAPRLMNLITDEVEQYVKFKNGEIQREFVSINIVLVIFECMLLL